VFGAPYVEDALAMVLESGSLGFSTVGTGTSVVMLIRFGCVLKTLHTGNER